MRLPIALILCIVAATQSATANGQHLLEFTDDFFKPARCQRDAWEERMETERHDFTQSATTVGRGVLQIESGYSYFYKDSDEIESSHTAPETLLRWGVTEDIELRLRWNYAWKFIKDEEDESGSEDLRYSIKLQMTRPECDCSWMPLSALEVRGTAPTGGDDFTTNGAELSLDYIYQWQLTENMTIAGSTGFGTDGFGDFGLVPPEDFADAKFTFITQSAVLGMDLTNKNTAYFEWFGVFTSGLDEEFSLSFLNVGFDHYFTDNFLIDFRLGAGLNETSDDFFSGVGGGFRF